MKLEEGQIIVQINMLEENIAKESNPKIKDHMVKDLDFYKRQLGDYV